MLKRIVVALVIFALLSLAGCSKAPDEEMQKANSAIEVAKTAEAEEYAPDAFQTAMDTLNAAMAAKQQAASKFALVRSYGKSKELFDRAEALAKEAEAAAQTEKERVKVQATELMAQAKAVLDSAQAALSKAPKGKGSKADIELMKNDLAAAAAAHQQAMADLDAGKYAAAKAKLEAAIQSARRVSEEIQKAVTKKMGR
jgi:colicin import membrane protein